MRRFIVGVALGTLLAASATWADKTLTIKTLVASDFPRIVVESAAGVLTVCGTYQLKDSTGADVGNQRVRCKTLTAGQQTMLVAFIRDTVGLIADANTAEGL